MEILPACSADKVSIAADRNRTPLPGQDEAHGALHHPLQLLHQVPQLLVLQPQLGYLRCHICCRVLAVNSSPFYRKIIFLP